MIIHGKYIFANDTNPHSIVEEQQEERIIVENLFKERAKLWNDLYSQDKNLEELKNQLRDIIAEPLLTFDLEVFESLEKYPSDFDKINSLEIMKLGNITYGQKTMSADVTILWNMKGLKDDYLEQIQYRVVLLKDKGIWKLSDYNILQ